MTTVIPVLKDQLLFGLSSLAAADRDDSVVVMMEVADETTYVRHHKAKVVYILSVMRHHAEALRRAGWTVDYQFLEDEDASDTFNGALARAIERHRPDRIVVIEAASGVSRQSSRAGERCSVCPSRFCFIPASCVRTRSSTHGRRTDRC